MSTTQCPLHTFERTVHTPAEAATLLASGCGCDELAHAPESTFAAGEAPAEGNAIPWSGVIGFEGQLTGDGRIIEDNALTWDTLPMALRWSSVDNGGHSGAQVVGRITELSRGETVDGQTPILGKGDFDAASELGLEAARQVDSGLTAGVSMDLDAVAFEVRVAKDMVDGSRLDGLANSAKTEEGDHVTLYKGSPDDEVMATTGARIRAATMVAIPAFEGARIQLDGPLPVAEENEASEDEPDIAVTASGEELDDVLTAGLFPVQPPVAWFSDPKLDGPTPLTVDKQGRVYGHLAVWGTCHTGYRGQCVEPPRNLSAYAYFRTGSVVTKEGVEVGVGQITMNTGHAAPDTSARNALAHYDNTGNAAADVTVGEDAYGIWVSGALRPDTTPEQVRVLRASPLSGDWRRIGGQLELVAALAVNVPGFPVPRPKGLVAAGAVQSLVASGMIAPENVLPPGAEGAFSVEDLKYLKTLIAEKRREEHEQTLAVKSSVEEMAAALAAEQQAAKIAEMAAQIGVGN